MLQGPNGAGVVGVMLMLLLAFGVVAAPIGAWKLVRCARIAHVLRRHPWVARRARYRDVFPDLTRSPKARDKPILLLIATTDHAEAVGRVWEFPRNLMELSDAGSVWVCGDPEHRAVVALPSGINFVPFRQTTFGEDWMRRFVLHEKHDDPTRWRRIGDSFRRR